MLSIIVPVHNQFGHNQLFLEGIRRYTTGPYEIIVIDNHSTDGSADFFEARGCQVIRNPVNLCYPESMNLGIRQAKGDHLCLINNDLYVGPNWNGALVEVMEEEKWDVVSPLGMEKMPTPTLTAWMHKRWNTIGRGRLSSHRPSEVLRAMLRWMYGDWEQFCEEVRTAFYSTRLDGVYGPCLIVKRSVFEKLGLLDERIQASDWDFYLHLRKREAEVGDVKRGKIVGAAYVHHYMRATMKGKPEPFACRHPRLSLDEKWTREELRTFWHQPEDIPGPGPVPPQGLDTQVKKLIEKIQTQVSRLVAWRWGLVGSERILELYRERFRTALISSG
jgi:GT2 family glycosyltransferase